MSPALSERCHLARKPGHILGEATVSFASGPRPLAGGYLILRFAQDDRGGPQDDRGGPQDDRGGAQDDRGGREPDRKSLASGQLERKTSCGWEVPGSGSFELEDHEEGFDEDYCVEA